MSPDALDTLKRFRTPSRRFNLRFGRQAVNAPMEKPLEKAGPLKAEAT